MARKEDGRLRELKARSDRGEISAFEYMAAKRRIEDSSPDPKRLARVGAIIGIAAGLFLAVVLIVGFEGAETPDPNTTYATRYGDDWPFPFEEATVQCQWEYFGDIRRPVVTLKTTDGILALNGAALDLRRYKDSRDYMPRDSVGFFTKGPKTVSALINTGLNICGYKPGMR